MATHKETPMEAGRPLHSNDRAHLGRSVLVKGELSGSEDLFVDGEVHGSIELRGHSLVVGPNSHIRANINARHVVIQGRVEGNVTAAERVELKHTAALTGDIVTKRIAVEEGASFKGSIDLQKDESEKKDSTSTAAARTESKTSAMPAAATPAPATLAQRK
jgi:cytoskeletal protein CcmA (bactofilin family)